MANGLQHVCKGFENSAGSRAAPFQSRTAGPGKQRLFGRPRLGIRAAQGRHHCHALAEPVLATKRATSSIPIVFGLAADPVGSGLVASLAHPGGNVTGLSVHFTDLAGKRLELLREAVPHIRRLAIMANAKAPGAVLEMQEVQAAARALGIQVATTEVQQANDIGRAFERAQHHADALYVASDPLLSTNRFQISTLAIGAGLPTMHGLREHADAGALISYGANHLVLFRRAAELVDKILKGTRPADIPIEQPTTFELVINLKTAKALASPCGPRSSPAPTR